MTKETHSGKKRGYGQWKVMYRTWKLFRDLSQILEISASSEFMRNMLQKRTGRYVAVHERNGWDISEQIFNVADFHVISFTKHEKVTSNEAYLKPS